MLQILYVSTARTQPSEEELEAILKVSRTNNRAAGVTGLLVSGGRRFLQALEGPDHAVRAAMHRIRGDARHFALVELSSKAVESRAFGDWDMAYRKGADAGDGLGAADTLRAMIAPIGDKNLDAVFAGFADIHDRV